jgi:MFS family permease
VTLASSLRALRHRDFRLFTAGQAVSLVGTWMQMVAQGWLIYRLTGSAAVLGLATCLGQLPLLLLAPVGGLLVDRIPARRLLLATQTLAMLLATGLGLLTLAHRVQLWQVLAAAFALGLVNAFDNPGRQVFVWQAVPREDLLNAVALNASVLNGARILGPALAAILVALAGEGWCFLLNGASYLAVIGALGCLRSRPRPVRDPAAGSSLGQLRAGFAFAGRTLPIRNLLLILGCLSLAGTSYVALMPVFAGRVLHGGPGAMGLLMGASGVGALAGSLALVLRKQSGGLSGWVAGAAVLFGAGLLGFACSRSLLLSALLLVPVGCAFMVATASINTFIQMMVPDRFRGRVMALYTVMFLGMVPVGGLLVGGLARCLGPAGTVALAGAGALLAGAVFALSLTPAGAGPELVKAR